MYYYRIGVCFISGRHDARGATTTTVCCGGEVAVFWRDWDMSVRERW